MYRTGILFKLYYLLVLLLCKRKKENNIILEQRHDAHPSLCNNDNQRVTIIIKEEDKSLCTHFEDKV